MKTSANGVGMIKRFEGLELEAYQDIAGIWTVGYGHTGPDVQPGMRISERDAEELLKQDLRPAEENVSRLVRVPLNQNEFDALISFVYNVGAGGFGKSTARRRLNSGDRIGAADALTWWNKATVAGVLREVTGLTRRRAAERALFLEPTNPPIVTNKGQIAENSRVTPIEDAPRRSNLAESRGIQGAAVAGGAGVAASTMGRESAQELDQLETQIETGEGLTLKVPQHEQTPPDETQPGEAQPVPGEGEGAPSIYDTIPDATTETREVTETGTFRPSKEEKHAVDAQVQFALTVLIVLAVFYVILSRIDDWWRFRR
jgi:lysozyme